MIIKLEHINKNYGEGNIQVAALKDVCLEVEEGEYLAIMGPSGSGKSTLMNILGCLDTPTSGSYSFDGREISGFTENELSNLRLNSVGFIFQQFHLLPQETALDNVALPLGYAGIDRKKRYMMAHDALERVGLGERVDHKPNQLSGGQKQRVAIARAMVNNPRILLADEPTGALDQKSGKQIMELFAKLNEEGATVIMITHDANVAAHAKRQLKIVDGMLLDMDGNPVVINESKNGEE